MDKQFSVSLFEQLPQPELISNTEYPTTMIVDFDNPVSADYIERLTLAGRRIKEFPMSEESANTYSQISEMVVFLQAQLPEKIDPIIELVKKYRIKFVSIISTFRSHFADAESLELEDIFLNRLKEVGARAVILRCGHILSDRSQAVKNLQRFAFISPLIPSGLRSCCISGEEVFEAIDAEQNSASRHGRIITLLGPNRPWKEFLKDYWSDNILQIVLRAFCSVLGFLLLGHLAAFLLNWLIKSGLISCSWNFDTLKPRTMQELLSLANKYNFKYVKVVGYNNGVIHYGDRYPGKTVISTINCNRIIQTGDKIIKVDCGATIRQTLDFLTPEQEPYVIPNYSYVSMGTAFFIPIHGSGLNYTTIADNIIKVVLYDPKEERFIVTSRDEPTFKQYIFDMTSEVLLLRLYLQVKPKAQYFLSKEKLSHPNSQLLLDAFCDETATNVEIRKSNVKNDIVYVYKYYSNPQETTGSNGLELPRDSLGSLWDRLEEKPITSWLLHVPERYLFWSVELFLFEEEFIKFWETHRSLPIRKIQLRYVKCDGFPNSPFRDRDCISVDFALFRKHRQVLEEYLRHNFAVIRYHPGKHRN